jgi:hypothetical protein
MYIAPHWGAWSRGFAIKSHKELLRVNEAHRRTQVHTQLGYSSYISILGDIRLFILGDM